MTEVLYICLWYKDKKRTWSGTAWSLRQAMEPYLQVQDLALSDPLYRKNTPETAEEEGTEPRAGPAGPAAAVGGDMLRGDIGTGQTKKCLCFSLAVGRRERIWHPISIRTFPFPRFCGCRGKIRWAIGTASMIRCRKRRWNAGRRDNWSNTGKVKGYSP